LRQDMFFASGSGECQPSLAEKSHPWPRSELNIGNLPGIASPAHVASNNMAIFKYPLHDRYMAPPVGSFDPGLEHNNRSRRRTGRDAPTKLIGAIHPLPGIRLRFPGNKD